MSSFAWLRARPRAFASAGAVTAAAVTITTLAFVYQGVPTTEVDLHDGGVWVTKQSSLLVGHFNHESQVLDGALRTTSDDYDILQSGSTVLLVDDSSSSVSVVDPAMVALSGAAGIPGDADVALGGETVAILDRTSGDLWVVPSASVGSFQIEGTDPTVNVGKGADVAVGLDALTGEERRDAVLGMCGSLVECQLRGLVDRVVRQSAERLLQDATIEIAALAIALHGPAEARALFPIRLPMPDSSTARRSGGSS